MDRALLQDFITLFVVCDPLGSLPVLMSVSEGMSDSRRRRLAALAVLTAFLVLALFAAVGRQFLDLIDISVESFRIAGGMVLFLFGLTLIFGQPKHEADLASSEGVGQTAVFPIAIPSIASPGAMLTATLLAGGGGDGGLGRLGVIALLAAVMAVTLAILMAAGPLHRVIGDAGAAAITRVMGMILTAIAVDEVLKALIHIGALAPF